MLTTVIQPSQAVGVAVLGSLFLTLDARGRPALRTGVAAVSGHTRCSITLAWIAVTLALQGGHGG